MLRLVTSPPVVLMVALVVCGQADAGTSPPSLSQSSTTEQTSYQVLQAILKHDDPIRTIGRINQRFVLLTEKKNLFDLPASAWDNSSHKLKLDNVTTVEKHWPKLLTASPIAVDPSDQNTLLAFHTDIVDLLLWIPHQAGSCPAVFEIATGEAHSQQGTDVCGKQPGLDNPSTRYLSSSESDVYYYSTQSSVNRVLLTSQYSEQPATNCTSPLNYTVGFQDGPKYYLFSSQSDHLDIVDMATCQIESLELSSFFVCTPDPTTPTPVNLSPRTTSSSNSNVGLIVGIVGGVIGALVLIGLAFWCLRSDKKHKKKEKSKGGSKMATSGGSAIKHATSKASGSNRKNSKLSTGSVMSARTKGSRGKASHVPSKVNASKRKASKAGGKAKASKVK